MVGQARARNKAVVAGDAYLRIAMGAVWLTLLVSLRTALAAINLAHLLLVRSPLPAPAWLGAAGAICCNLGGAAMAPGLGAAPLPAARLRGLGASPSSLLCLLHFSAASHALPAHPLPTARRSSWTAPAPG